jgi:hypothetical protein
MASITITYTDNGDGTATVSTTAGGGSAGETFTTKSLAALMDVSRGWVQQSIPTLVFN